MQITQHWLNQATHRLSPNHDKRPDEADISLIVIHCISLPSGQYNNDNVDLLFSNKLPIQADPSFQHIAKMQVSAHLFIRRNGDITQYVPFNMRAWHAGKSRYQGRSQCNDFSIGIELEGTDDSPYQDTQYLKLAHVIKLLIAHYPQLTTKQITGHSTIAPDRKSDPGHYFNWGKIDHLLKAP
ncbi:MAG: 1,6-anhydro-N-acetylmuramyl-L-alanine amidase AmpD [Methylococcales bacterium]|jgi:AmpD protein|nr:1,6-anhydro-N-acetylmuramyl-L-alanine amidase AmpD [Methylococcales bacterium]